MIEIAWIAFRFLVGFITATMFTVSGVIAESYFSFAWNTALAFLVMLLSTVHPIVKVEWCSPNRCNSFCLWVYCEHYRGIRIFGLEFLKW